MRPRKWFYVQCEECTGSPASFSHTTVASTTEQGAYEKGREYFKANPTQLNRDGWAFLNDYVIQVNG